MLKSAKSQSFISQPANFLLYSHNLNLHFRDLSRFGFTKHVARIWWFLIKFAIPQWLSFCTCSTQCRPQTAPYTMRMLAITRLLWTSRMLESLNFARTQKLMLPITTLQESSICYFAMYSSVLCNDYKCRYTACSYQPLLPFLGDLLNFIVMSHAPLNSWQASRFTQWSQKSGLPSAY